MKFSAAKIPGVIIIEPQVFTDERGFFMESFQGRDFSNAGIKDLFVQDNHSGSKKGILRGLHYQVKQSQGKLVRLVVGEVFDVVVDLRRHSPTFGQWEGYVISAQNKVQLYIPPGFAHGFYVLSDWAEMVYKTTDYYAPQFERTLLWNDTELCIQWPLIEGYPPVLSTKDANGLPLSKAELFSEL
jgi:dTDP-4-dehydrorhamnose 3,5-epimerase